MSPVYSSLLEFLSVLQPYAAVIAFLDKSSIFSTLTAAAITAALAYIVFFVPRFVITFDPIKIEKSTRSVVIAINNRKYFVSFNADEVYCHFWIPSKLFKSKPLIKIKDSEILPHINKYVESGIEYLRIRNIQPFPMFPQSETATIEISAEFNFEKGAEYKIFYFFSTRHGYYPKNALKKLNPLRLPNESISMI